MKFRPILPLLLMSFLVLFSCEDDKKPTEDQLQDSLAVEDPGMTRGMGQSAMRPELVGTWKQVDMRMGGEPLAQAIPGNSYLQFFNDGSVAITTDDFPPDTAAVYQNGDMLRSDIWLQEQRIDSLTATRLILTDVVDGEEVAYIYERQ